jgi:hypothetical protein
MGANWWKTSGCASGFSAFAIGFRSRQNSVPGSFGMCSTPSVSWAPVGIPRGVKPRAEPFVFLAPDTPFA